MVGRSAGGSHDEGAAERAVELSGGLGEGPNVLSRRTFDAVGGLSTEGKEGDAAGVGRDAEARGTTEQPQWQEVLKQVAVPEGDGWNTWIAFLGPGFLVAIAYIDPGNFQSNLQAGAKYKYELLWVLLLASIAAGVIQSLAIKLGIVTGMHLAEHCREGYSPRVKIVLWLFAEVAIVASDIPEVIGTAFALKILFGLPIWGGVLITGCSTLLLLGLQKYGVRKLEFFIAVLVMTVAVCFFVELGYARPDAGEVLQGMFVPKLSGSDAFAIAISLVGCVVMPHNLFLHSGLVLSRDVARSEKAIRAGCRYNFVESGIAIFIAFLINVAIITVSGAVCSRSDLADNDRSRCDELNLDRVPFLLRHTLGSWSGKLFGIALLAAGQSSTITGTYAGQYVMQGFLHLKMSPWLRNLVTRSVAIIPSLAVALIGGAQGAGRLIIISSIILSFELPFALLPLLKFTNNPRKMGSFVNSRVVRFLTYSISFTIILANVYYLASTGYHHIFGSDHMAIKGGGGAGLVLFLSGYILFIGYLAFRPDGNNSYALPHAALVPHVAPMPNAPPAAV